MPRVTMDLSKREIVEILSQLSPEELKEMVNRVEKGQILRPQLVPMDEVLKLKGIISVGGDALIDSERIYNGRSDT